MEIKLVVMLFIAVFLALIAKDFITFSKHRIELDNEENDDDGDNE